MVKPRIKLKLAPRLKVVPHPRQTQLTNVPGMLHYIARQMEDGTCSIPKHFIWIDDAYNVGLIGQYLPVEQALGIIQCGAASLTCMLSNGRSINHNPAS